MPLDMKEIERKAYTTLSEDGIVDIAIGFLFLSWGITLALGLHAFIGLVGPFVFVIWYLGKKTITIPRIGLMIPSKKMENKLRNFAIFLLALGLIVFAGILLCSWGMNPCSPIIAWASSVW